MVKGTLINHGIDKYKLRVPRCYELVRDMDSSINHDQCLHKWYGEHEKGRELKLLI